MKKGTCDIKIIKKCQRLNGRLASVISKSFTSVEARTPDGEKVILQENEFEYISEKFAQKEEK